MFNIGMGKRKSVTKIWNFMYKMLILLALSVIISQIANGLTAIIFAFLSALLMIVMVFKSVVWIKKEIQ